MLAVTLSLCLAAVPPAGPAPDPARGLVVEAVIQGSAGDRAGLRAGDSLLDWASASDPARRESLATPFDLLDLESVEAPRGPVILTVRRGGVLATLALGPGEWGLRVRPALPPRALGLYEAGRGLAVRSERARAWDAAADAAQRAGDTAAACWLFTEAGRSWAEAADHAAAEAALARAMALAPAGRLHLQALEARARARQPLVAAIDDVTRDLDEVIRARRQEDPDGLATAEAEEAAGLWSWTRGDISGAEGHYREALRIRAARVPRSLAHAKVLRLLGLVSYAHTEWDAAEALFRQAFEIAERLEPRGNVAASALNGLGNIALHRGGLGGPEALYRQAIALREAVEPFSLEVCRARHNLGVAAMNRGDAALAEEMYEQAHACFREAGLNPRWMMNVLAARGSAAAERGQLAAARDFLERAVAIAERLSPTTAAFQWRQLGEIALLADDPAAARRYFERAYAQEDKEYADSLWRTETLARLGEAARREGDLPEARVRLEAALARQQSLAPGSLTIAWTLQALGDTLRDAGDDAGAALRYRAALEIRRLLAPASDLEAESLRSLGVLSRRAGRDEEAAALLRQAVEALEAHAGRVGGAHYGRTSFRARSRDVYRELADVLVGLGRPADAFAVVERSRARVFLEWLARRDLPLGDEVPPELAAEMRAAHAEYETVQGELQGLSPVKEPERVERLAGRLRDLQARRGLLVERVRAASPHAAALRDPEPLDAAAVAAGLDPGTVLLTYAVGPDRTHLFVLGGTGNEALAVYTLDVKADVLRGRVAAFREHIGRPYAADAAAARAEGRALFDLLIAPAEDRIAGAKRIAVCPDGPLHLLPFAALVRRGAWLVEWKPLHVVASATVYAEQRNTRARGTARPLRLAAFGDARPAPDRALPRLLASRGEVAAIGALFPRRSATYVGTAATEARAKALGRDVSHVHFACHARLDERFPLDSALLLSPGPGADNGVLQAWEIFEGMRLDADLVTLSACDTALGADMGGEGLLGLTRAFLYAGARSVVAALWSVSDRTTAALMRRFYAHLVRGVPKDEALRAAQVEMVRAGGRGAQPFRWAVFQVFGDWR